MVNGPWPATGSVRLRGGSIAVRPQRLAGYARLLRDAAAEFAGIVPPLLGRLGTDPSLLAAALLDPAGALLSAELIAGCLVLLAASYLQCQLLSELLIAAAGSYQLADQLDRRMAPMLRAGEQLPAALLAGLAAGAGALPARRAARRAHRRPGAGRRRRPAAGERRRRLDGLGRPHR